MLTNENSSADAQIRPKQLTITEPIFLAAGAQGEVYKGIWCGREVAVKTSDSEQIKEIKHLQNLKHNNVVQFLNEGFWNSKYAIVMEFCGKGSLRNVLESKENIGCILWMKWLRQLVDGMCYLHSMGVVHRDLKTDNVLLTSSNDIRVSDFGIAREKLLDRPSIMSDMVGTCSYISPEVIRGDPYSKESDVWSFGVVLWEMLTRNAPYNELEQHPIVYNVGANLIRLKYLPHAPAQIAPLLKSCMSQLCSERPTFAKIRDRIDVINNDLTKAPLDEEDWDRRMTACKESTRDCTYRKIVKEESSTADQDGRTPLHEAARSNTAELERLLRSGGANAKQRDKAGEAPIHTAAEFNNAEAVALLLEHGVTVDMPDGEGRTPLHRAAERNATDAARLLLTEGADANLKNMSGEAAIHTASAANRVSILEMLLYYGVDVNSPDDIGQTPLHHAARTNAADAIRFLIERDADASLKNKAGMAAIHTASQYNNATAVKTLLEDGVYFHMRDNEGQTPIHHAAKHNAADVIRFLIDRGGDPTLADNAQDTPLHIAANNSKMSAVRVLVEEGVDINEKGNEERTALHYVAAINDVAIARYLLESGADATLLDKSGYAPIHVATMHAREAIVRLLIDHGVDVEMRCGTGRTSLHYAARENALGVARCLLMRNTDATLIDEWGRMAIHIASYLDRVEIVRLLVGEHGCDVDSLSKFGLTPLFYAVMRQAAGVAAYLLDCGADATTKAEVGPKGIILDPMHYATIQSGKMAIHVAASNNSFSSHRILKRLLSAPGVHVDQPDALGRTPLQLAAKHKALAVARTLLEHGADPTLKDVHGKLAIHHAYDNVEFMRLLVEKQCADINVQCGIGRTPLHYAVESRSKAVMLFLLRNGADGTVRDEKGLTVMTVEVENKYGSSSLEYLKLLIDNGIDVNLRDGRGRTPLHVATRRGWQGYITYLLERGADPSLRDQNGRTVLIAAITARNSDSAATTKLLLENGVDVNLPGECDNTPLHYAAMRCVGKINKETSQHLLQHGADVMLKNENGQTPLHAACSSPNEHVARLHASRRGPDLNEPDVRGHTPLHAAVIESHDRIVRLLLEYGADTTRVDMDGNTALHLAKEMDNRAGSAEILEKHAAAQAKSS